MRRALLPTAVAVCLLLLVWWLPRGGNETAPPGRPGPEAEPVSGQDFPPRGSPELSPRYTGEDRVRITGLALDATSSEPIRGATVTLLHPDGVWGVQTDARGRWQLDQPPARRGPKEGGDFGWVDPTLEVSARGYLSHQRSLNIWPAGTHTRICTHLRPIRALLTGRVVDFHGAPVAGAWVSVGRFHSLEWQKTDASGRFNAIGVPAGRISVSAHAPDRGRGELDLLIVPEEPPGNLDVEVVLGVPRYAHGRVVDSAGRALPGVELIGSRLDRGLVTTTDALGQFRWLLPVTSNYPGYVEAEKEGYTAISSPHELDLMLPTTMITLCREQVVEGVVLSDDGIQVAGLEVRADAAGDGDPVATRTDQSGRFVLKPLCPGVLSIQVNRGSIPLLRTRMSIRESGRHEGVVLRIPPLQTCTGRVTDALTGLPLQGVRVVAGPQEGDLVTVTDATGSFEFPYGKNLHLPEFFWLEKEGYYPQNVGSRSDELVLSPLARVRMRVVDPDGRPLPGADASFKPDPRRHTWWFPRFLYADADGRIEMDLPVVGTPLLEVDHRRHVPRELQVTLAAGETMEMGDVRLERPMVHRFVVRDEEGKAIPDAYIVLSFPPGAIRADADGRIRAPCRYQDTAYITAPGRTRIHEELTFPVAEERVVTLTKGAAIRGRVVNDLGEPVAGARILVFGDLVRTDGRGRFELHGFPVGEEVHVIVDEGPTGLIFFDQALAVAGGEEVILEYPRTGRLCIRVPEGTGDVDTELDVLHLDYDDSDFGMYGRRNPCSTLDGSLLREEVSPGRMGVRFFVKGGNSMYWSDVTVEPNRETVLLYDFPRAGRVTGRVVDDRGLPVVGAELVEAPGYPVVAISGEGGCLEAAKRVVSGVAPLVAKAEGFAPTFVGLVDLENGADLLVRLTPGGTVRGKVLSADGSPCADASLRLRSATRWVPHGTWVRSDQDGSFIIPERTPAGSHVLEIRGDREYWRPSLRREIQIETGRATEVEIRLP